MPDPAPNLAASPRLRFAPAMRLRASDDVRTVVQHRRSAAQGPWQVFARLNDLGHLRLCVSIRRTVAKAHDRNRVKRVVRETFRLLQHELPAADYVVSVRTFPNRTGPQIRPLLADLARAAAHRAAQPAGRRPPEARP